MQYYYKDLNRNEEANYSVIAGEEGGVKHSPLVDGGEGLEKRDDFVISNLSSSSISTLDLSRNMCDIVLNMSKYLRIN